MSPTPRKATKSSAPKSAYAKQLDRRRAKEAPPAEPTYFNWIEPDTFSEALKLHMHRHAESCHTLWNAIVQGNDRLHPATIRFWRNGSKTPRSASSMRYLNRIEARYSLPLGYFAAKLPNTGRARSREPITCLSKAEQRRFAWHLPENFNDLPSNTRQEILEWVRRVIISGTTEYRRYHARSVKQRFGLRFPDLITNDRGDDEEEEINYVSHVDPDVHVGGRVAPPRLTREMRALLRFKTSTLTPPGYARRGAWGPETAAQKVEHLGLMLGALTAPTTHSVRGYGVELNQISLAHLVFPAVWDWYVQWRERRRGFYTMWEVDMLGLVAGLTSESTGWLTQTASLTELIVPLPDIVTASDAAEAKADWRGACARMHAHATMRAKEIARVSRVHRDPFEPILPVLEAPSPLREYRKIADEIERLTPDTALYPTAAAQARRALLIFRFGLHLGLRQKNLRQLLFCPKGAAHTTERQLERLKRGELRWIERDEKWEVFIPSSAFKNARSSFFGGQPFRLSLPTQNRLYDTMETYMRQDRAVLLKSAPDPGTFFVKTTKSSSVQAEYDQHAFYEAWRLIIQRYGIYNPYTKRGAIKGLLPHGPHNVRDVLATHILKQTGSFEQASYAIQDTPDIVAKHYGRFLPENKSWLAAQILNRAWED